eukprot:GHUV01028901.1.p1 GENE.GHUV01028901.1~~GHUV01028901.1.p1  ORF type:complete len:116 (-),score=8.57 GHUV01028901.1:382-729(-)
MLPWFQKATPHHQIHPQRIPHIQLSTTRRPIKLRRFSTPGQSVVCCLLRLLMSCCTPVAQLLRRPETLLAAHGFSCQTSALSPLRTEPYLLAAAVPIQGVLGKNVADKLPPPADQ